MYVLMDIEWITNRDNVLNPTQFAALRVDQRWQELDSFYARIFPLNPSFYEWGHMAYSGGRAVDFMNARTLTQAFEAFLEWVKTDDVLCFWHEDSVSTFRAAYSLVYRTGYAGRILVLRDYLYPYLRDGGIKTGNPYKLMSRCGLTPPTIMHHSDNDVRAMLGAVAGYEYPQELLDENPPKLQKNIQNPIASLPEEQRPYQYDELRELFHKRDCPAIPVAAQLSGYADLKYMMRKKLRACPECMKKDLYEARVARNQDIIDRTDYRYVYALNSQVYHRRDCKAILHTSSEIRGSAYYQTVVDTGRRPCKLCNPTGQSWTEIQRPNLKKAKKKKKGNPQNERSLSEEEKRAIARFRQAKNERISGLENQFETEVAKNDFYILTQPRFAFWAAEGYQTFHLRHCRKLNGVDHLKGFARYKDATRAGHKPCKFCKPSEKHDIVLSIPITNQKNSQEKVSDLANLCMVYGYPYSEQGVYFCMETPVGKWKINTSSRPYILHHINLIVTPDCERGYHKQPRIFLSLEDTFNYIHRHDHKLIEQGQETSAEINSQGECINI